MTATPAERRALEAVVRCGSVRGAAEGLSLSPHTVDETLDRLRRRTGLHTTPQLAAWAAQQGWLRVEPVEHDE
ncbi:MAG: LysR family transcriptional regulator [Armatimonadetes bacterium]|nr:LysR family transcriptional regulator [Armatimonadota bacterium]